MGKTIIVTSGPTNERIDDVMKITNMSTGALGAVIAENLLTLPDFMPVDKVYYVSTKMARKPPLDLPGLELVTVESTQDLLDALSRLLATGKIDAVVHSAAVGDYKGKYVVRGENLAAEIAGFVRKASTGCIQSQQLERVLLRILESPECALDDDTKISSYEPHLMVGLDLTPKVIRTIKAVSPDTMLIGFKLLSKVTEEELVRVATKLCNDVGADYIVANDLSLIRDGKHPAIIVNKDGGTDRASDKLGIAHLICNLIFKNG